MNKNSTIQIKLINDQLEKYKLLKTDSNNILMLIEINSFKEIMLFITRYVFYVLNYIFILHNTLKKFQYNTYVYFALNWFRNNKNYIIM